MTPRYLKRKAEETGSVLAIDPSTEVSATVKNVIDTVRREGDLAVRQYSEKFDKWSPKSFRLSKAQIHEIISTIPKQAIEDIKKVQANVRRFAEAQKGTFTELEIETEPGVFLGHKNIPIQKVGA